MKKAYILHHLGLGDHILCNSIFRYYAKKYSMCILPVKERNRQSLSDMLADVENIQILSLGDEHTDNIMIEKSFHYKMLGYEIIGMGLFGEGFLEDPNLRYDKNFYLQAGLDFEKRWSDFYYPRNEESEYNLFKQICGDDVKEGEYIFLHEDASRGFRINRGMLPRGMKIITPGIKKQHALGDNENGKFFNYGYILENAAMIHCIESSFAALIDSIQLPQSIKKHAHRYARPEASNDYRFQFTYKTNWNIISFT